MKKDHVKIGVDRLTKKLIGAKAVEDAVNNLINFFEQATHLKVKNKPYKMEIEDRYR